MISHKTSMSARSQLMSKMMMLSKDQEIMAQKLWPKETKMKTMCIKLLKRTTQLRLLKETVLLKSLKMETQLRDLKTMRMQLPLMTLPLRVILVKTMPFKTLMTKVLALKVLLIRALRRTMLVTMPEHTRTPPFKILQSRLLH
jgi:hypothetical protein